MDSWSWSRTNSSSSMHDDLLLLRVESLELERRLFSPCKPSAVAATDWFGKTTPLPTASSSSSNSLYYDNADSSNDDEEEDLYFSADDGGADDGPDDLLLLLPAQLSGSDCTTTTATMLDDALDIEEEEEEEKAEAEDHFAQGEEEEEEEDWMAVFDPKARGERRQAYRHLQHKQSRFNSYNWDSRPARDKSSASREFFSELPKICQAQQLDAKLWSRRLPSKASASAPAPSSTTLASAAPAPAPAPAPVATLVEDDVVLVNSPTLSPAVSVCDSCFEWIDDDDHKSEEVECNDNDNEHMQDDDCLTGDAGDADFMSDGHPCTLYSCETCSRIGDATAFPKRRLMRPRKASSAELKTALPKFCTHYRCKDSGDQLGPNAFEEFKKKVLKEAEAAVQKCAKCYADAKRILSFRNKRCCWSCLPQASRQTARMMKIAVQKYAHILNCLPEYFRMITKKVLPQLRSKASGVPCSLKLEAPCSDLTTRFSRALEKLSVQYPQSTILESLSLYFHGTAVRNVQSIQKRGLIVGGTNGIPITHGRAHGAGVYLGDSLNVSMGYGTPESVFVVVVIDSTILDRAADNVRHLGGMTIVSTPDHILPLGRVMYGPALSSGVPMEEALSLFSY